MRYPLSVVIGLASVFLLFALTGCKQSPVEQTPPETAQTEPEKAVTPPAAQQETAAQTQEPTVKSGESLFKAHCDVCHPNGGNIIAAAKTLVQKDREANQVNTAEDIIHLMRNPGPGMQKFDESALPEDDARLIAEYVLNTFK